MKRILFTAVVLAFVASSAIAQDVKEEKTIKQKKIKKETEEIVIRKKGEMDIDLKVEIKGDNITVNGKPLSDFKDENVTINKRKMIIRDGKDNMIFNFDEPMIFEKDFMQGFDGKGEMVTRPFLGVTTETTEEGAKVTDVVKESAAEKAGLQEDDIIISVDGKKITEENSLSELVGEKKPKQTVSIAYLRDGKENKTKATIGERKVNNARAFSFTKPRVKVRSFSNPKIAAPHPNLEFYGEDSFAALEPGAAFNYSPFTFPRHKKLGLKIQDTEEGGNIKVIEVEEGSAAEKAGLKKDDVITEIGGKKINNTDEAREQLNPEENKNAYSIKALRNGSPMNFDIKIPKKLKTADL